MNRRTRGEAPEAKPVLPSGKPWEVTFRRTEPVMSRWSRARGSSV
ncbi:hypothetical protein [Streptomyces luteogriseus]|uniref:Uncharacterized protein n=1 Tax=Streptomyces luteogriseus TaxID=68233 RepID=A0A7W7DV25_9ACTN|nr:hypothetical protein [Streptomyces luteogriseus]MBB4717247.1 hypothetical protein [Streptomyces luteogriseus]